MATTSGTNIVPDEQQFLNVLNSIFNLLEEAYLKNDESKKKMALMNSLKTHLNLGGKAAYSLIPQKFSKQVENMLYEKSIPYFAAPDEQGNSMIIVRDKDYQKFLEVQKAVECLSTEYAKELTPRNILELYKTHGLSKIDTVTIKDPDMAAIAENKLYQAGVTFAKTTNPQGDTCFMISPMSKFSTDGKDLCSFELIHALEQSKADKLLDGEGLMDTRIAQARFDDKTLKEFAMKIKKGQPCILHNAKGTSPTYIEVTPLGVSVTTEIEKDGMPFKDVKNLDIKSSDSVNDILAVISKQTDAIKNMTISTVNDFEKFEELAKEGTHKSHDIYTSYKRPQYSSSAYRDVIVNELEPMLKLVNEKATAQVNAYLGKNVLPQSQLYEMKKNTIEGILAARDMECIKDFLEADNGVSKEVREEWLNNIESHYTHQNEVENQYEAVVDKTKKSDIKAWMNKSAGQEFDLEEEVQQEE